MTRFKHVKIRATGSAVPARVVPNQELAQRVSTTNAWILENLGIAERRIAGEEEFTSDLACCAAQQAIKSAQVSLDSIELIIVATATPDRRAGRDEDQPPASSSL